MARYNLKNVMWNELGLKFEIDNNSFDDNERLQFYAVQNDTHEIKLSAIKNEDSIFISIEQLALLEIGDWQILAKETNKYEFVQLHLLGPAAPKKMSFLKPAIHIADDRVVIPNLTKKNKLNLKVSTPISIQEQIYPTFETKIFVEGIFHTEISTLLLLTSQSLKLFKENVQYELVIYNNNGNIVQEPLYLSKEKKGFLISNHKLKSLKGLHNFYVRFFNKNIIERYEPLYQNSSVQESKYGQTYNFNINQSLILSMNYGFGIENLPVIKGHLSFLNYIWKDDNSALLFAIENEDSFIDYKFYIKRRGTEERFYIDTSIVKNERGSFLSIDISCFNEEFVQNTRWDLFAENHTQKYVERNRVGLYSLGCISDKDKFIGYHEINFKQSVIPYVTKSNEISFHFTTKNSFMKNKFPIQVAMKKLDMTEKKLNITIDVWSIEGDNLKVKGLDLTLRSDYEKTFRIENEEERYDRKIKADFQLDLLNLPLEQFYWDFYVIVEIDNQEVSIRLANDSFLIKKKLKHLMFKYTIQDKNGYLIYPYVTINGGVSLTYRLKGNFEERSNKLVEYLAYLVYSTFYQFKKKENIWLIHEKFSETAQDNSFYFFKYCYENQKDKPIYYVIKKGTADEANLTPYLDRVVYFMSYKHLLLLLRSTLIVSSEAKGHGYAWRVSHGIIREHLNQKKYVFLQHGVLGLKKVDSTFNYNTANTAELFVVSSEFEKEIVKEHFGYKEEHMAVTGLSRWDVLEDHSEKLTQKEIFLMPTWRNWLEEVTESEFVKSDYYKAYDNLLNSDKLLHLLNTNNIRLNFYVHPKFMPYVKSFVTDNNNIRILAFGEEKVNTLLMKASLLITDYSSVAWEMYYQKKPVVFFQFDLDKYEYHQGAYMDLQKDLFGDACYNVESLVNSLSYYIETGFEEKKEYVNMRNFYFKYTDHQNSSRIFNEINKKSKVINRSKTFSERVKNNDLLIAIWRRYKNVPIVNKAGKIVKSRLK
ncbi:CDP-glycerol glycerophosphotransferase family protein [Alkalihalobacillus sp. LMS6]|uniref:CDP-glycerol glycerophosphotransferase family protein n=1 Tax=Alkalihalobacillus sp. LMS6 TaxID=2924034 RepID=UPI0020D1AD79|nr:CDP-glycerol glycerophosphotransferase family protein [Alkalihalobacillus sp. LMS6]UTR05628.1 CDP-glycerol glycerophosphotransferase family protein [Alkalihalobacillus sp. LMS6]